MEDPSLKPGAVPYTLYTPRHISLPLWPKVELELNRMEALGVISKVDKPTVTLWGAGMVVASKKEDAISVWTLNHKMREFFGKSIHSLIKVD